MQISSGSGGCRPQAKMMRNGNKVSTRAMALGLLAAAAGAHRHQPVNVRA